MENAFGLGAFFCKSMQMGHHIMAGGFFNLMDSCKVDIVEMFFHRRYLSLCDGKTKDRFNEDMKPRAGIHGDYWEDEMHVEYEYLPESSIVFCKAYNNFDSNEEWWEKYGLSEDDESEPLTPASIGDLISEQLSRPNDVDAPEEIGFEHEPCNSTN